MIKKLLKRVGVVMLSASVLATAAPGAIGNLTDAKAANIASVDVDLTSITPSSDGDIESAVVGYDPGKYDTEITYSMQAMIDSGQVKSMIAEEGTELYLVDLNNSGNYDIMYGVIYMGSSLATASAVVPMIMAIGTRDIVDTYSVTLNDASVGKVLGDYATTLNFKFLPAHNHKWGTNWKSDKDAHWHPCGEYLCSCEKTQKDGYAEHTYGKWTVKEEATDTKDGSKERTCSVCGYKDVQVIPKGTKDDGTDSDTATTDDKKTDDGQTTTDDGKSDSKTDSKKVEATTLKVTASPKSVKKNYKKNQKIKLKVDTNSKGKVSYKVTCSGKKLKKYVSIKKGVITVKKKAPKGTIKVTVKVAAKDGMKSASKTVSIKVK